MKRKIYHQMAAILLAGLLAISFSGCASQAATVTSATSPSAGGTVPPTDANPTTSGTSATGEPRPDATLTFKDAKNRTVTLGQHPLRVVAAEGSFAEIWTLAGGQVIGIPEDVITDKRMAVTPEMKTIGSIKEPNSEIILGLEPDFVILSADIESHARLAEILDLNQIPYGYFKVEYFKDYLLVLNTFTGLTGHPELYINNGTLVQSRVEAVLDSVKDRPAPSVLLIRAFAKGAKAKGADNATGSMLAELGAENMVDRYPSLLEDLSLEEIVQEDPDQIFITTMGSTEQAMAYLENGIMANPAWQGLTAVQKQQIFILPKDLFHYKPNARWDEAYDYLAKILYP